ncbi:MAG: HAMP domain-containing histidine kinase [Kiritimatiellae bacterium]|nr:HAMP domain-containing histidine kinase [Kiritimatiellia bacterium]
MSRSSKTWGAFLVFLAIMVGAMGWVSVTMLRLEAEAVASQREAQIEEVVRLALWRLDSAAMAMVIEESSRPYQDYWAFNDGNKPLESIDQLEQQVAASPLLAHSGRNVNVYFNGLVVTGANPNTISSPQVPPAKLEGWALSNFAIADVLPANSSKLETLNATVQIQELQKALVEDPDLVRERPPPLPSAASQQLALNAREFTSRRAQAFQAQHRLKGQKQARYEADSNPNLYQSPDLSGSSPSQRVQAQGVQVAPPTGNRDSVLEEGIMRPAWVNDLLILGRNVRVADQHYIQGAWLNWDHVKTDLLGEIHDILPSADLVPIATPGDEDTFRMLAVLPARLVPGSPAGMPDIIAPSLRMPLSLAWVGLLVSVAAVAALLFGAIRLSERRGAFVSAVTHELRTPLTTFKMYTEMLAEGLVNDPAKQQNYLDTLHSESNRLGHLVENVLAYARLERGPGSRVLEPLTAATIIERNRANLERRSAGGGMELIIAAAGNMEALSVKSDLMAVGQILFNLVDNACKYAAQAADTRIHFSVSHDPRHLLLCVCDHGPGLKSGESRMVFRPFRKSARQAARSAPGVGLGLALCRSLARQLGGDVSYESRTGYGACFVLRLPLLDEPS